jgi:hypothetical protein
VKQSAVLLAATVLAGAAVAAPMGFKDSRMLMADFSPTWREVWGNHAFTARDAFGAGGLYMRADDGSKSRTLAEVTYTRLLQRWNLADAQANVWLFVGAGAMRGSDFDDTRPAFAPGLQVDWETTRLYLAATGRLYRARDINHDFASLRAGFSFYEADYDEVQPWLVLEARRVRGLSDETELMPMLRLIHSRFFVEFGVSTTGQGRANLMITF